MDRGESRTSVESHTLNCSEGGIAIATPEPLVHGETLSLELHPDPDRRPVLATGRVIFSRETEDGWIAGVELCWVDGGVMAPEVQGQQAQTMWSFL